MTALLTLVTLASCSATKSSLAPVAGSYSHIEQARLALAEEDLYEAKRATRKALEEDPQDLEAEELMAEVINQEISRQLTTSENKIPEEYNDRERADAIKTWLERASSFLEMKRYEEAMISAEKVFLFDASNPQASRLIDKIRNEALKEGKGEVVVLQRMYQREIKSRIDRYLAEAKEALSINRIGTAKLSLEKVLLLEPENKEALKLYKTLTDTRLEL